MSHVCSKAFVLPSHFLLISVLQHLAKLLTFKRVRVRLSERESTWSLFVSLNCVDCVSQDSFHWRRDLGGVSAFALVLSHLSVGILPPHHDSHAQVMAYRKDQYSDVLHALRVVRFISDATPQVEVYLRMYQLESGKLPRSPSFPLVSGHSHLTFNSTLFLKITFYFVNVFAELWIEPRSLGMLGNTTEPHL